MSRIYFTAKTGEAEVRGAERFHMGSLSDLVLPLLDVRHPFGEYHPIAGLLPEGERELYRVEAGRSQALREQVHFATSPFNWKAAPLTFNGASHSPFNLTLATLCTMGPALALCAKLHGYCEIHAWVRQRNRDWLAGVIESGRASNILRPEMGWEETVEFLRDTEHHPGPVVTSYSVTEHFPSMSACEWMDPAWPAEMVTNDSYNYSALDEAGKKKVDDRQEQWYESLSDGERWELAMEGIRAKPWLELTPETLETPTMTKNGQTLWDAVLSPEWRGH